MKKVLLTLLAFLTVGGAWAQKLTVGEIVVAPGQQVTFPISFENGSDLKFRDFQMTVLFPEGITVVGADKGDALGEKATADFNIAGNETRLVTVDLSGTPAKDGVVWNVTIKADATLEEGTLSAQVIFAEAGTEGAVTKYDFDNFNFDIVVSKLVTLDEESTTAPAAAENVNVLVKRTIKAGNWSTICLPFAMDAGQVNTAFGEGVKLADFKGYDATLGSDGVSVEQIKVNFESATAIEANHPYLIKVPDGVTYEDGFKVENVTIAVSEAVTNCDVTTQVTIPGMGTFPVTTTKRFIGTYVSGTIIPENKVYLSGNKFWYSKGNSTLKAFRGYFDFSQVLADVTAGAKISFNVDGDATSIDGIGMQRVVEGVYDLSGRKIQLQDGDLNKLQKGVYIINGKKVTIK